MSAEDYPTPPLANQRTAEDFTVGQQVLHLASAQLVDAEVHKAMAYSGPFMLGPSQDIAPEELAKRRKLFEQRKAELQREVYHPGLVPDEELLRLSLLFIPDFQMAVPNPSPGFLHLKIAGGRPDLITDMDRNTIIPLDAWQHVKRDEDYRADWLANGSKESLRERDSLLVAIHARIEAERATPAEPVTPPRAEPKRALPRHGSGRRPTSQTPPHP